MTNQETVITALIDQQWIEDGHTRSSSYKMMTQSSYPHAGGGIVRSGGRPRLRKANWKVSVGERTTYFYQPSGEGQSFPTKNLVEILEFALQIDGDRLEEAILDRIIPPEYQDKS